MREGRARYRSQRDSSGAGRYAITCSVVAGLELGGRDVSSSILASLVLENRFLIRVLGRPPENCE